MSLDEDSEVHDAAGVVREEGGEHPMMDNPVPTVHCLPDTEEPIAPNAGCAAANMGGLPADKE